MLNNIIYFGALFASFGFSIFPANKNDPLYLSLMKKMKGLSILTSLKSENDNGTNSMPVAAAPSVPSTVTYTVDLCFTPETFNGVSFARYPNSPTSKAFMTPISLR